MFKPVTAMEKANARVRDIDLHCSWVRHHIGRLLSKNAANKIKVKHFCQ
jgi:hypothetical protein